MSNKQFTWFCNLVLRPAVRCQGWEMAESERTRPAHKNKHTHKTVMLTLVAQFDIASAYHTCIPIWLRNNVAALGTCNNETSTMLCNGPWESVAPLYPKRNCVTYLKPCSNRIVCGTDPSNAIRSESDSYRSAASYSTTFLKNSKVATGVNYL